MSLRLAVTAGSESVLSRNLTLGRITAMTFPAGLDLPRHEHPDATVAVVLSGGFLGRYAGVERDCSPMTLVVEPAGASHANRFGGQPSTILSLSLVAPSAALDAVARAPRFTRDAYAAGLAQQADTELHRPDELTPLAVEGLALELVTRLGRTMTEGGAPGWLAAARDLLHERFAESLRLGDVASAVGVEPERLARAFRGHYHEPMATYVRRLRVNAAASLLVAGPEPTIAAIAAEVGFSDQSHLTRCFVQTMGTTPARYREAHR
jgi:AraC-like DNA-binding protein/quercetin dioxygenase-like cupin family protein